MRTFILTILVVFIFAAAAIPAFAFSTSNVNINNSTVIGNSDVTIDNDNYVAPTQAELAAISNPAPSKGLTVHSVNPCQQARFDHPEWTISQIMAFCRK